MFESGAAVLRAGEAAAGGAVCADGSATDRAPDCRAEIFECSGAVPDGRAWKRQTETKDEKFAERGIRK
jgi:hypothetical protein